MSKTFVAILSVALLLSLPQSRSQAQSTSATTVAAAVKTNTAIIPAPRADARGLERTEVVLKRARENPGSYDVAFIGDSITHRWETSGESVWQKYYAKRKCINLGVGGDRTQHVLWRFEHGQLDGIKPKVTVLMIGTNNSNKDDNTEAEILQGVTQVVEQIRARLPETKLLLLSIFPRGQTFSTQRGKILQVNQALSKLADGKNVFWVDFGAQLIEKDGSISKEMMPDYLHPVEPGYEIWAESIEPYLKKFGI